MPSPTILARAAARGAASGRILSIPVPGLLLSALLAIPAAVPLAAQDEAAPKLSASDAQSEDAPLDESLANRLLWAGFEVFGSNAAVWAGDLVGQQTCARISPESWETNLREGFVWDNSDFFTNQILHPYQGSFYYNSARMNGFSFWPSAAFTASGSLMWEFFGERDRPSINDVITTTLGGAAFGEASYRLSAALLHRPPDGARGLVRRAVASVINPVGTVNHYLLDRPWPAGYPFQPTAYDLTLRSGLAFEGERAPSFSRGASGYLGAHLRYGEPFHGQESFGPYDYFEVDAATVLDAGNNTAQLFGEAVIYGHLLYLGDESRGLIGVFQHFDYLQNPVYYFAANGAGVGALFSLPLSDWGSLELGFHAYGIALGGVDSPYSVETEGRDYCLGPGAAGKSSVVLRFLDAYTLSLLYNHYYFETLSGAGSHNQVDFFTASFETKVEESLAVGLELTYYNRWAPVPIDESESNGLRLYAKMDL